MDFEGQRFEKKFSDPQYLENAFDFRQILAFGASRANLPFRPQVAGDSNLGIGGAKVAKNDIGGRG